MRHRKSFNHLGRTASHRKAMLANMASSLILHKRIETTTAKAKALKMYLEPLMTKSKVDSTHSRRVVFSYLQNKEAVTELFREVSPKIVDRPGGYTRILKTGTRLGDNADMCIIELVDYNENLLKAKEDAKEKSGRRRRRGGKKKTEGAAVQPDAVATEAVAEKVETREEVTDEVKTEEPVAEAKVEAKEEAAAEEKAEEPVTETEAEVKEEPAAEEKKEEKKAEAEPEVKAEEGKKEEAKDQKDAEEKE